MNEAENKMKLQKLRKVNHHRKNEFRELKKKQQTNKAKYQSLIETNPLNANYHRCQVKLMEFCIAECEEAIRFHQHERRWLRNKPDLNGITYPPLFLHSAIRIEQRAKWFAEFIEAFVKTNPFHKLSPLTVPLNQQEIN